MQALGGFLAFADGTVPQSRAHFWGKVGGRRRLLLTVSHDHCDNPDTLGAPGSFLGQPNWLNTAFVLILPHSHGKWSNPPFAATVSTGTFQGVVRARVTLRAALPLMHGPCICAASTAVSHE